MQFAMMPITIGRPSVEKDDTLSNLWLPIKGCEPSLEPERELSGLFFRFTADIRDREHWMVLAWSKTQVMNYKECLSNKGWFMLPAKLLLIQYF